MASSQDVIKKKKKQQQRQASNQPRGSSSAMPQESSESQLNLQAVRRLDEAALDIVFTANQVSLYEFRNSLWVSLLHRSWMRFC